MYRIKNVNRHPVMTQYYIISFALHYNLTQSLQEEEENRVKGEERESTAGAF